MKKQEEATFKNLEKAIAEAIYSATVAWQLLASVLLPAPLNPEGTTAISRSTPVREDPSYSLPRRDKWLSTWPLTRVLEQHDRFLPEFSNWRKMIADHAAEIAHLLMTYDNGEGLNEDSLHQLLVNGKPRGRRAQPSATFEPWTNRWTGIWSNGVSQYHVWDSTRALASRWVQPVSLSETRFVNASALEAMFSQHKTDVAINVVNNERLITGWVSKRQGRELELPHIGYLANDTTLIWICQVKTRATLFDRNNRWFVFLETVNKAVYPAQYRIYGLPVEITDRLTTDASERDKHQAVYYSVASSSAANE